MEEYMSGGTNLKGGNVTTTTTTKSHHHQSSLKHNSNFAFYGSGSNLMMKETNRDLGEGSDERDLDNKHNNRTTDAQTMMHILKANIGTGVLAMPNAFKQVGLWLGFILVPLIGAICIHCMNILIASHNRLCDKFNYESLDYDQVAALGLACGPKFARRLAKKAHIVVTVFLIFTQVGFCCVYIMFVVENIQLAILNLFNIHYSTTTYLLLVFPLIGLTSCTSNLKHLARISTLANILQLTGLALIFFDLLQFNTFSGKFVASDHEKSLANFTFFNETTINNQQQQQEIDHHHQQDNLHLNKQLNIQVKQSISADIKNGLPLFFATAVYAFEGIGVVLPLIKEMQYPNRISGLNGVLNTSMSMVAILYMGMGFFGYAKYGQFVQGSITLNLPETTLNEIVRLIFAIAIGFSYSLQFYVPWTIMWPFIDESLFYSYRPRDPRDKLDILKGLTADNEWAIDESEWQVGESTAASNLINSTRQHQQQQKPQGTISGCLNSSQKWDDDNSTASTFATSYAVSTYHQQSQAGLRRLQPQQQQQQEQVNLCSSLINTSTQVTSHQQYGAVSVTTTTTTVPGRILTISGGTAANLNPASSKLAGKGRRNRLEDVMEQEDDMPEVQWRPPPRSMRGKRKLVRYTVILVSVSFTFVAAALIPRLDLFIALIGALASSCLAIIFPAIIQMCTFWSSDEDEDDEDEDDDEDNDEDRHTRGRNQEQRDNRRAKRIRRKRLFWWLFVCKNFLLIVFGILGLITGSYISLSQLSAAYMGIESET